MIHKVGLGFLAVVIAGLLGLFVVGFITTDLDKPSRLLPEKSFSILLDSGEHRCIHAREMVFVGGSRGRGDHYDFYATRWGEGSPIAIVPLEQIDVLLQKDCS